MKTKNLFIVRHGQTEYNKQQRVQGSGIDAPLNETGKQQAASFYKAYKDYPFDKLYISGLQRTYQSFQGFIDNGLSFEKLTGLNEISWGEKEGQYFSEGSHQEYADMVQAWKSGDLDMAIRNGESPNQVMERQRQAMQVIMSNQEEQNVLICMHGRAMRILLCWMLNHDLRHMDMFSHENLCLYKLAYTGTMFRVELFDDRRHLNGTL